MYLRTIEKAKFVVGTSFMHTIICTKLINKAIIQTDNATQRIYVFSTSIFATAKGVTATE